MKKVLPLLAFLWLSAVTSVLAQSSPELHHLASYETGMEAAAEVVAYDATTKRVFFTNSSANTLSVLDISTPSNPTKIKEVDLAPYGAGPNSVAVKNGVVAVAVESDPKTDPGHIVFFDTDGNYVNEVEVGALPDMIVFTSDGTKLLVANEGEPNDDYDIDPEGTVSIVEIDNGGASASATQVSFSSYNDKKASLLNKGIRIYGPNATVAQDLEPEFIVITPDDKLAYVSCQEANALAVINIETKAVMDLLPLGYKDHLRGSVHLTSLVLNDLIDLPALGAPVYDGGQETVYLSGFSGLFFDANESTPTEYIFYVIPDRGPNATQIAAANAIPAAPQDLRPFKLPEYQARIPKFKVNILTGTITLEDQIFLTRKDGTTPISGKGNIPGFDEVPVTYADPATAYANVDFTDPDGEEYHQLPYDEFGGDFEGILRDKDGYFWMCDEYRPAIYKFDTDGTLIERYVPEGTHLLGTNPVADGAYGEETLPEVYSRRWANRGFEAIAYDPATHVVYAFIQSPMENPDRSVRNKSDIIRILGVDADSGMPVSEYVYLLERNKDAGYALDRVDKIGDAVYAGDGKFMVLERDSSDPELGVGKKYVFEISIKHATNVLGMPIATRTSDNGGTEKTLEMLTAGELETEGIVPAKKIKITNLPTIGYRGSDKPEGIAILPGGSIAVVNDNDFGLAGAGISDNTILGIIRFNGDYGMDASDRDDAINIAPRPVLGMYQPDAMDMFQYDNKNYIVTVNEGDSRDYDGYSEETRVKDLILDAEAYPDAAFLQEDEQIGRLKTTEAIGDYDGDGDYDQVYSFGARSFSIWDAYGNQVFDSGESLARIVADQEPEHFNEDEGESDGRSDDKGVEPEAVAVGTIDGFTYAFVGTERQSAILVYDITDPKSPEFVTYYTNRDIDNGEVSGDVSPEIIKFVPASDSPNGENLLVVGYEVSGSVGIIQVGGEITSISEQFADNKVNFKVYPNPAVQDDIYFDKEVTLDVFDMQGRLVSTLEKVTSADTGKWESGMYLLVSKELGTRRFLKMD